MTTQKEKIYDLMRSGAWIDQFTAFSEAGCMRLASRICDLKRDGHPIEARVKRVHNRWGEECYVKEYRLLDV